MTARRIVALLAAVLALAFGWRWHALGRAVDANRRAMTAAVREAGGASGRVADAVHENEARFEATLHLAAARRTAGWLALVCAGGALMLGAIERRRAPSRGR